MQTRKGFTLVEFIIVIALSGIIFLSLAQAVLMIIRSWDIAHSQTSMITQLEVVFNKMERSTRQLKDKSSLVAATATNLRFIDLNDNDIRYYRSGNMLMQNSKAMMDNITSLTFQYLDKDGNIVTPIVSPLITNVKYIRTIVTATINSQSITERSLVRIRNFR